MTACPAVGQTGSAAVLSSRCGSQLRWRAFLGALSGDYCQLSLGDKQWGNESQRKGRQPHLTADLGSRLIWINWGQEVQWLDPGHTVPSGRDLMAGMLRGPRSLLRASPARSDRCSQGGCAGGHLASLALGTASAMCDLLSWANELKVRSHHHSLGSAQYASTHSSNFLKFIQAEAWIVSPQN